MKFNKRAKEHVNDIIKYIISLGGNKICEAISGTIYCELSPIKKIRISDHLSLKSKTDCLQIIIQKEGKRYKYICILNRNILLLSNVGQVKQWIRDIRFVMDVIKINGYPLCCEDDSRLAAIKKDVIDKDNKLHTNKKEIERLNEIITEKDKLIKDKINKLIQANEWHNKYQKSESENKKLQKQLKELYIWESHFNDG